MAPEIHTACMNACAQCALACHRCSAACLRDENVRQMAQCIALDMDCAGICELSAAAMARESANAPAFCRVCAEICDACADECAQHPADHCQACAEACRSCASACRRMAA